MKNIRISVQLHPQHCTMQELLERTAQADALGADCIFTWDHFFPLYGVPGAPMGETFGPQTEGHPLRGHHFEAWTLLTAMACHSKKAELGILVTCNSYRNPQLLADMARTVDHVSQGRLILGVGSGWYDKDYAEYGYPFGDEKSRLRDLKASLPVIQDRLGKLQPAPIRSKIPIMIGGGGEKVTLKLTAQYADMWNYFGTPEQMAHKISVLNHWCSEVGRDSAQIEKTILLMPAQVQITKDLLARYLEVGVTHFILGLGTPFDLDHLKRALEMRA